MSQQTNFHPKKNILYVTLKARQPLGVQGYDRGHYQGWPLDGMFALQDVVISPCFVRRTGCQLPAL